MMSMYNSNDGIEQGSRVVMVKDGYLAKNGDRGELVKDDGTHAPKFKWDKGVESYEHLNNMKPLTLDDAEPSEWDEAAKATMADAVSTGTGAMKISYTNIPASEFYASTGDKEAKKEAIAASYIYKEVDCPAHYNEGGVECIDYIRQQLGEEGFIAYCEGNVIKYHHRWRYKGGLQDLKKARKYHEWMVEALEAKEAEANETMMGRNQ